jgi:hypothetical protein
MIVDGPCQARGIHHVDFDRAAFPPMSDFPKKRKKISDQFNSASRRAAHDAISGH